MSFWQVYIPLSILLLAVIGAKLIGPDGDLQVSNRQFFWVDISREWPNVELSPWFSLQSENQHRLFGACVEAAPTQRIDQNR